MRLFRSNQRRRCWSRRTRRISAATPVRSHKRVSSTAFDQHHTHTPSILEPQGKALSRYDGIPISIKDNFCTTDLPTTCASRMLQDYTSPFDATLVAKLRAHGFIVVGKTNMDEFGMG